MDDLLPRRKIGIVRAIRVEEPLDTPLGQQEQEEEASSSSLSNAKSSVVTPEDSPREEAESKLKLEKKRLRKQTISSHRKDNQDSTAELCLRYQSLSFKTFFGFRAKIIEPTSRRVKLNQKERTKNYSGRPELTSTVATNNNRWR